MQWQISRQLRMLYLISHYSFIALPFFLDSRELRMKTSDDYFQILPSGPTLTLFLWDKSSNEQSCILIGS
jgi:hypothetical protein